MALRMERPLKVRPTVIINVYPTTGGMSFIDGSS